MDGKPKVGNPGIQWEKLEAWRHHPLLKIDKRNLMPGITFGLAAFAIFVVYDKTKPKAEHH